MRAHSMFDTRTKARSLAFLYAAGTLSCVLTVLLPHAGSVEERSVLVLGAISLVLAIVILRLAGQISNEVVHVALAAVTVMLSLVVHYTQHSTLYALTYTWPALYAF